MAAHHFIWSPSSVRESLVGSSNEPAVACSCGEWRGPADLLPNRAGKEAARDLWANHILRRVNELENLLSAEEMLV